MSIFRKLGLQFFADGGDGGASGVAGGNAGAPGAAEGGQADSGVNVADAERQELIKLGVPESKIRKGKHYGILEAEHNGEVATAGKAAGMDPKADAKKEGTIPDGLTWDQIMSVPEFNQKMQDTVKARLKDNSADHEKLEKLAPAIELIASANHMDMENLDYDAIAKSITDDSQYYEDRALELGVPVETAKRIDQMERSEARRKKQEQQDFIEQNNQRHIADLVQQGEKLKAVFPDFDLRKEIENPVFRDMVRPGSPVSLEDAYYAVHHNEIQSQSARVGYQRAEQQISSAIRSGSIRPTEAGTSVQAPSSTSIDWSKATKQQRDALKARIMGGEIIYPGHEFG